MRSLRSKLRHAFAVDPTGPAEPTEHEKPAVEWICRQIAKRHMTTPGLIGLEMVRPLNWIGAQVMHFASPGVWAITRSQRYGSYLHFARFLEQRGSIEYMCRRIEELEAEYTHREVYTPAEDQRPVSKTNDSEHHEEY